MSTATPPSSTSATPPFGSRASSPQRVPVNQSPAAAPASGFGNIDPIRLLRRYWPLLTAAAFVGAVIGTAGHFALLRVYPMYSSAAVFQCRPETTSTTAMGTESVQQADFDRFMGTQMQIMTSADVLQTALNNSELASTQWAKQFYANGNFQKAKALPALQSKMSAKIINQTTLIRLSMTWKNKDEVRAIVAAVAGAYMEDLRRTGKIQSSDRRDVLTARSNEIKEELKTIDRNRDKTIKDGGMTNLREGADEAEQTQAKITQERVDVQQQGAQFRSMLERLRNLQTDNAVIPYPEDMYMEAKADPIIGSLDQQMSQLRVDEAALMARGFDKQHDAVQAVRRRMEAVKTEQDQQMRIALQRTYDARLKELKDAVDSTQAREDKLDEKLAESQTRKQDLLRRLIEVEQLEARAKELNEQLSQINQTYQELDNLASNQVFDRVRMISAPQTPNEVTFPKLAVMLPLGVLLLTGLTASVILLRELMDQRVKGPADVAMIPRLRVLGMVPDASEDPSRPGSVETAFRDTPGGVITESFRQVRAPLVSKLDSEGLRTVLFLAGMPGSGGTTVATNLAIACAGADDKVLLIDANFRRPAIHRVLGVGENLGLADCLAGQISLADSVRPSTVANLSVLTAGSAGNRMLPERLSSEAMARVLAEAAAKYDRVFIDAPPAIVSGDGLAIANRCDAVVMVVRALNEKRGLVNRIRMQLSGTRADLVGVVVNGVKSSAGGYFKRNIQATHEYHNPGKS